MYTSLLSTTTKKDIFRVKNFIAWLTQGLKPPLKSQLRARKFSLLDGKSWLRFCSYVYAAEVESWRTSLASRTSSRTHFEVFGLEALGPRKLICPRLEDSIIFEPLKFCRKTPETSRKFVNTFFSLGDWSIGLANRASHPN